MIKLITYTLSLVLTFVLGYYLGSKDRTKRIIVTTPPTKHSITPSLSNDALASVKKLSPLSEQHNTQARKNNSLIISNKSKKESPLQLFSQLLTSSQYDQAITLYNDIWDTSQSNAAILKNTFLKHLHWLMTESANSSRFSLAIDPYLANFYDDIDVLLILTKHQTQQHSFYEAMNTLQLAFSYALNESDKAKVKLAYYALIKFSDNFFTTQQKWEELINIYIFAENTGLLTTEDRFRLVEIYLYVGNQYQAKIEAETLLESGGWENKVAKLLQTYGFANEQVTNSNTFENAVKLTQVNNHFIVPVTLSNQHTKLLLDTGASITTITQEFYDSISSSTNMKYQTKRAFYTANGKVSAKIYTVDQFKIGNYTLKNLEIAVLDYPTSNSSNGLLGMNVLRNFRFEIDQKTPLLKLNHHEQ